jgi:hypothetical protein
MSIRRDLTFICDECGSEQATETDDFGVALARLREEGWVSRKDDDGDWCHYCGWDCANSEM